MYAKSVIFDIKKICKRKKEMVLDTIYGENKVFGNTKIIFTKPSYEQFFTKKYDDFSHHKADFNWDYIYNVQKILGDTLEKNGLPRILFVASMFELEHFKNNSIDKKLPYLFENSNKLFDNGELDKKQIELCKYFGFDKENTLLFIINPFLVLTNFVKTLKKSRTKYKSDFALLNTFVYSGHELQKHKNKKSLWWFFPDDDKTKIKNLKAFDITTNSSNNEINLVVDDKTALPEVLQLLAIYYFVHENLKDYKPSYQLTAMKCNEGDSWEKIAKSQNMEVQQLKYFNRFIKEAMSETEFFASNPVIVVPVYEKKPQKMVSLPPNGKENKQQENKKNKQEENKKNKQEEKKDHTAGIVNDTLITTDKQQLTEKEKREQIAKQQETEKQKIEKETNKQKTSIGQEDEKILQEIEQNEFMKQAIRTSREKEALSNTLNKQRTDSKMRYALNNKPKQIVHIVKNGETLYKIHQIYKVTIESIIQNNKIKNTKNIYIGQKITILIEQKTRGEGFTQDFDSWGGLHLRTHKILPRMPFWWGGVTKRLEIRKQYLSKPLPNHITKRYKFSSKHK